MVITFSLLESSFFLNLEVKFTLFEIKLNKCFKQDLNGETGAK